MEGVYIAGAQTTAFGKQPETNYRTLAVAAARGALADSGVQPADVDAIVFGNAMLGLVTGQEQIRSEVAFGDTELAHLPMLNVENACCSGGSAIHVAWMGIAAGVYECVLVVGAEKLTHPDKSRTLAALSSGLDVDRQEQFEKEYASETSGGAFMMDIYAEITRRYMAVSEATEEDLAAVVVKNRAHAALNPNAQYRAAVTADEVLGSRTISDPIRLLMCSPIADGAAAVVLCSGDLARRLSRDRVRLAASVVSTSSPDEDGASPTERAAARAFEAASVGPEEIGVAEIHDASAPAELIAYEELGFCAPGDGPKLLREGHTGLGGRLPTNTSGGLIGRGHPVGATGCAQVVELYDQLMGRAGDRQIPARPRFGLAENHGGYLHPHPAVAAITMLEKV